MRNHGKFAYIFSIASAVCPCVSFLCGCALFYDGVDYGKFYVGYSKYERNAFVGMCEWNGNLDEMIFDIPDEYEGMKITELGGYIGRGYPCPFGISFETELYNKFGLEFSTDDNVLSDGTHDEEYETLVFTVRLGKYIKKLTKINGKKYLGCGGTEDKQADIVFKIAYRFEADEGNPVFYARDGKLFSRSDDVLVDEFFYG